jgi:hypothetical protein
MQRRKETESRTRALYFPLPSSTPLAVLVHVHLRLVASVEGTTFLEKRHAAHMRCDDWNF